jgi:hypothetical protein
MPSYTRTISVQGRSAQELYDKISTGIDTFLSRTSIGKYELNKDPTRKEVQFKSSMASATLECRDGAIQLQAQLSLLAAPFRGKLDEGIDRWIAKTFSA